MLPACNKTLDLKPLDQLSDVSYFQAPNDFKVFANQYYGYYKGLAAYATDGNSDITGGGGTVGAGANTVPATDASWTTDWSRVRATNYLLGKATSYTKPTDIAQYVAEARFFRAYLYFDLLSLYGRVPIITQPLTPESPILFGPRSTRDSVVDFIISDLQAAIPNLPASIAYTSADYGRVTKTGAQAFLARVSLYEGTWQKFRNGTRQGITIFWTLPFRTATQ